MEFAVKLLAEAVEGVYAVKIKMIAKSCERNLMPRPLSLLKLTVLCFVVLGPHSAWAQVFNSSTSAATGLTGRAAVEAGDSVYLNPSSLAHLRGRHFYAAYSEKELAFTLSDNSPDATIPAALGYFQREFSPGNEKLSALSLALAEFGGRRFSFGLTGHFYSMKDSQHSHNQINADLGMMFTPTANMGLALVAYNLLGEESAVPSYLRPRRSVGVGFNYVYKNFARFRVDVSTLDQIGLGVETFLNKFIVTRLGYFNDWDSDRDILSLGVGFKGPKFTLNYAYQANIQNSSDSRHSVDLTIPF